MHYLKRALFYLSLAVEWCAYIARYWLLRVFGSQKDVAGVRVILVRHGRVVLVRHWFSPASGRSPAAASTRASL